MRILFFMQSKALSINDLSGINPGLFGKRMWEISRNGGSKKESSDQKSS